MSEAPGEHRITGIALVLGSALVIAFTGVLVKEALDRGSQADTLLTVRYAMAGLAFGVPLVAMRAIPRTRRTTTLVIGIGAAMWAGGSCEFEALARVPLSVVIVILFISPLWIALHSWLFRHEQLGWQRHAAFAAVFAGIVLLVGPALGDYNLLGLAFALGSSFIWAGILLMIDAGRKQDLSPPLAIGWGAVVAGIIALAIHPGAVSSELGDSERAHYVIAVGLTAALSFALLALGMRGHHVFDVVVVAASEPLFAVLLGAVFLDERLKAAQLLGVLLVAIGVVMIARVDETHASPPISP